MNNFLGKICLFCVIIAFFIVNSAQAKTDITQTEDCTYNVLTYIAFDFNQDLGAQIFADYNYEDWTAGIRKYWSENNQELEYNNCKVNYNFEFIRLKIGQKCADFTEYNCIDVVSSYRNSRSNLADALIVKPNSGQNSYGQWTTFTSGQQAAHEAGHMMGLADEKKNPNSQSIMAQTWGNIKVLPEHTAQIIESIK